MFCKKCGRELKEGAKFCPKCGEVVPVKKLLEQSQRKRKKMHIRIAAITSSAAVVVVCVGGGLLLLSNSNKSSVDYDSGNRSISVDSAAPKSATKAAAETTAVTTEPEPTTPELIQAVLDNESTWKADIAACDKYEQSSDGLYGNDVLYFQDFDMDGNPEFVVKSRISNEAMQDLYSQEYNIYDWDETNQKLVRYQGTDENVACTIRLVINEQEEMNQDVYQLYKDNTTGEFLYLRDGWGYSVVWDRLELLHLDKNSSWEQDLLEVWCEDLDIQYYDPDSGAHEGGCELSENAATAESATTKITTYAEAVEWYNNYKSNLTAYSYTTKKINLSDWDSMSSEEKQQALEDSYNAWSYSEGSKEDFPLTDVMKQVESESSTSSSSSSSASQGDEPLTSTQLKSVKKALGVPSDFQGTIDESTATYWEAGGVWLVTVSFYDSTGAYVAGAQVDQETAEPVKEIYMYAGSSSSSNTSSTSYKSAYKQKIQDLASGISSQYSIDYCLCDMNADGTPELITKTGTCEADYKVTFYTYKNNAITVVGDNFDGFHIGFYYDSDTKQFCTRWGKDGVGGVTWYAFDGNTVTETDSVSGIEYASVESGYAEQEAAFAAYGTFSDVDTACCSCDWSTGEWTTSYYTLIEASTGDYGVQTYSGIDTSLIDNY